MKPRFRKYLFPSALVLGSMICGAPSVSAELLYQWNFNNTDGANTGTGAGGTLTANVGLPTTPAPTGSFTQAGASGETWDHSLRTSNASDNWWGTDAGNAAALSSLDLSTVNQFTITMWVKRSGGNNADLINLGSTTAPTSSTNPGISIGLNGTWDNGMRIGVNGYNSWCGDLWSTGTDNDWCFVAIAYDGTDIADVWNNETMNALYAQNRNAVVITGDAATPAAVAAGLAMHTGDWGTPVGPISLGTTATAFLGSDGLFANGYSGNLDDVRIYDSLLTVEEIEAVRQAAFAEPAPAVDLYWKGDLDASWTSANWATGVDGSGSGASLATDGSMGIAFATTDAANLITELDADQDVRNIVVTSGAGATINGAHSLTIGADGIWAELTSTGLDINTTGGVVLGADQLWKNKSPNVLAVFSDISGPGTLTKGGAGPLELGGDNSLRTGATVVEQGIVTLFGSNALGDASASLTMTGGTLDLNGYDVTLGALAGTDQGVIHNGYDPCTLTLNVPADIAYGCKINDGPDSQLALVKTGPNSVTSNGTGNFTGPVSIEEGQFIANAYVWGAPNNTSLGNAQEPGRTITVTTPGSLALTNWNIFGNNLGDPALLPEIILNETTMSSTGYNVVGPITLNAATVSSSAANTENWKGYQFNGEVWVTGTIDSSTITGGVGNHLSSNTVFNVEDVTGDELEDLIVAAPLIDQSGDFASEAGGLTKTGDGTMVLQVENSYTGDTTVEAGTLSVWFPSFADASTVSIAAGATLNLDTIGETDVVAGLVLDGVPQAEGVYGALDSGAEFEIAAITGDGFLQVGGAPAGGYTDWATTNVGGADPSEDTNNDGVDNGIAYFMNETGVVTLPGIDGTNTIAWTNGGNIDSSQYGTEFVVQTSPNLVTWTDVEAGDPNLNNAAGQVSYTLPAGSGKLFVRLVVIPN